MRKPMTVNPRETSYVQHAQKAVQYGRLLDDMCGADAFEVHMRTAALDETTRVGEQKGDRFAAAELAQRDGKSVIRLISDVMAGPPNPASGRGWGSVVLYRAFDREDWSAYNRISFEVYPDLPGFRTVSLCVYLYNDGEVKLPDSELREGLHFIVLQNHKWNFCTWEFPELDRDAVIGFGFEYRLQGAEPGACREVTYDFCNLRLEQVEADHTKGWEPKAGEIVFSHTGYTPLSQKTAIAKGLVADRFSLIRAQEGGVAFTGPILEEKAFTGEYQVLDFSSFKEEGRYYIKAGDVVTRPFSIGSDVWRPTIEKAINFFYALRCGYPVPGIHDVCHQDVRARYGDEAKVINGGWHDAGDLSQGLINSSEAAYAMMALHGALRCRDPKLSARLLEEARWGQEWVLKTRFRDGYRASWFTMDFWTDGILGTVDDVEVEATRRAYDNFVSAASEALAAQVWAEEDAAFALYNLTAAREDFGFAAQDAVDDVRVDVYAQGILAATELYHATGEESFLNQAADYADVVMACQQVEMPDWDIPMRGFFYTTPDRDEILHYPHRGHEQAPMTALCKLYRLRPAHKNAAAWHRAIELYAQYIKGIVPYTKPYGMLPATIYSLDEAEHPKDSRGSFHIPSERVIAQIKNGVRLSPRHYLRLFPVWHSFRGNSGTTLSAARGVLECAMLLQDRELMEICRRQLEWHVGRNPFNQSLIWGEGYNYTPQYTATSGDIVGSFPVGVETQRDEDVPYWPDANCYNYKEVWVHPASRWLWLMEFLYCDEMMERGE